MVDGAWLPGGRRLVTASKDLTIRLWDAEAGEHLAVLHGHAAAVTALAAMPDGAALWSGDADGVLRRWDLTALDTLGNGITYRMNMYNPMYYLLASSEGYGTATPATHWRIRTGIEQGDTALTVETNLNLALLAYESVQDVDFATIWEQGHTMAERTGDSTANFIAWVNETVGQ